MSNQFVTLEEAMKVAKELDGIGGGVLPYNAADAEISGIYIPEYYGPFATPQDGEKKFYHLRFRNGAEGFNAGLVKRTMECSPSRWPAMIAAEVKTCGRW